MGLDLWEQPAPVKGPEVRELWEVPLNIEQAQEIADQTLQLVHERGWCAWACSLFGGEKIIIIESDEIGDYPDGHPVYTLDELRKLDGSKPSTLRLVNLAKKLGGAQVISVEEKKI